MKRKKYINPFNSGELSNPGVDKTESKKRTEAKLKRIRDKNKAN